MLVDDATAALIVSAFSVYDGREVSNDLFALAGGWDGPRDNVSSIFADEIHFAPPMYKWLALGRLTDFLNASDSRNNAARPQAHANHPRPPALWGGVRGTTFFP